MMQSQAVFCIPFSASMNMFGRHFQFPFSIFELSTSFCLFTSSHLLLVWFWGSVSGLVIVTYILNFCKAKTKNSPLNKPSVLSTSAKELVEMFQDKKELNSARLKISHPSTHFNIFIRK
jgi:hypothetical protein